MQKIEIETREKRNLIFSIVEACIVIGMTIWQVYYIEKLLDIRQTV